MTHFLAGANKLKANSSTLVAGVQTLQSGTNQLASGLNTLGSQMSSGAAKLSLNSAALREGAATLQSGARELADGMEKFDREGTSKLKSTVEDELGDVLDRFDAFTSDDCTLYNIQWKRQRNGRKREICNRDRSNRVNRIISIYRKTEKLP